MGNYYCRLIYFEKCKAHLRFICTCIKLYSHTNNNNNTYNNNNNIHYNNNNNVTTIFYYLSFSYLVNTSG